MNLQGLQNRLQDANVRWTLLQTTTVTTTFLTAINGCINDDAKDHVLIYNNAEAVGPLVDCIRNTLTDLHATMIA